MTQRQAEETAITSATFGGYTTSLNAGPLAGVNPLIIQVAFGTNESCATVNAVEASIFTGAIRGVTGTNPLSSKVTIAGRPNACFWIYQVTFEDLITVLYLREVYYTNR
jgi:hypothetical protein